MLIQDESLSRKFITKGAWIYFFVFLTAPLGYIIRIILTGGLTPDELGIIYGTISLLGLLGVYTDFGLTESLNYFLPKYIIKKDYARAKYLLLITLTVQIVTSSIVSLGLYFGAGFLADHFFHSLQAKGVIEILSIYFIGSHILQVITSFLNAIQNVKLMKIIESFRVIATASGAGILFFSGSGNMLTYSWIWIIGIYASLIPGSIIFYLSYYRVYFRIQTEYDHSIRKDLIRYSLGTLISANVATVLHQIDMQFLTYFLGTYETGIYSIYLSLIGIPFIFLGPIIGFLFPVISEIGNRKNHAQIGTIYGIFTTYLSVIIIWVGALFLVCGEDIAGLLFGERFLASGAALYYIAPFLVFNIFFQVQFQILGGLGYVRKRIEILIRTLLISIVVSLICILGFKYGYIPFPSGSAAVSFAVGVSWILLWYLSREAIGDYARGFDWRFFMRNLGVIVVFLICFSLLRYRIDMHFGYTDRMMYVPAIGFALFSCFTIFLILNFGSIREFITTIKKVRSGSL